MDKIVSTLVHEPLAWVGSLSDEEHLGLIVISQMITASLVVILNQLILKNKNLIPMSLWGLIVRLIKRKPIKASDNNTEGNI